MTWSLHTFAFAPCGLWSRHDHRRALERLDLLVQLPRGLESHGHSGARHTHSGAALSRG